MLPLIFTAALLGLIEGLTEFLPISSTGHLILAIDLLSLATPPGKVFETVIQLGAILAICFHYRSTLIGAVFAAPREPQARRFLLSILIAFLPAAVLGLLLHSFIKEMLFNPYVVAAMLIIGGFIILLVERYKPAPSIYSSQQISLLTALKIGLFQAIAMIPGTSRSGATIMGALVLGVERKAAAEFSFYLAIPTMLAAASYDLYKNWALLSSNDALVIAVGFAVAFASALLVVRTLLGFIGRYGFVPFAYYRIGFGSLMLALLLLA